MRNVEKLRNYFLGKDPQLKETMADNSLRLIGIEGKYFVLRTELLSRLRTLKAELVATDEELSNDIGATIRDLENETIERKRADRGLTDDINNLSGRVGNLENWKDTAAFVEADELALILAGYYTKAQVDALLNGKQDKLVAGSNITIIGNVISATGGGGGGDSTFTELPSDLTIQRYSVPAISKGWYTTGNHRVLFGGNEVAGHDTLFYFRGNQSPYFCFLPNDVSEHGLLQEMTYNNVEGWVQHILVIDQIVDDNSTHENIPTSKAVYDAIKAAAQTTDIIIDPDDPSANTTVEDAVTIENQITGETQTISDAISNNIYQYINPEYFYRFKNLVDNSSFEVFDGQTMVPLGWTGGVVSADASMFSTYSLKVEVGDTAEVLPDNQPDVTWAAQAYDTNSLILSFYHKFGGLQVAVYDIANSDYLYVQKLDNYLQPVGSPAHLADFSYKANWNMFRDMVMITPPNTTRKIRIEFTVPQGATREAYIDGVSLEPYVDQEYPSIYKDGRYSIAAYQVMNPPPGDVDRFTAFEHFNIRNGVEDSNGLLTYQELARADGTLAVKRQASNPDANGFYQTVVETFYKADGVTVEYVDTYTYTFSSAGAIKSRTRVTT